MLLNVSMEIQQCGIYIYEPLFGVLNEEKKNIKFEKKNGINPSWWHLGATKPMLRAVLGSLPPFFQQGLQRPLSIIIPQRYFSSSQSPFSKPNSQSLMKFDLY